MLEFMPAGATDELQHDSWMFDSAIRRCSDLCLRYQDLAVHTQPTGKPRFDEAFLFFGRLLSGEKSPVA